MANEYLCVTDEMKKALDWVKNIKGTKIEPSIRDCKTCSKSNNGESANTEECHFCRFKSQYKKIIQEEVQDVRYKNT